jgi:nucleotidyltransferase/DNA polymerase involved in DNA repair
MPIAQACRICPDGVFLRGNYQLYSSMSKKVLDICNIFTPIVQQASIDEAYMDLAGTQGMYAGKERVTGCGSRVTGMGLGIWGMGSGVLGNDVEMEGVQCTPYGISKDPCVSACPPGRSPGEPQNWPVNLAERLLREIRRQTGLGATIGIGSNKLVARIAMERAKPGGVCYVWPGYEAELLATCPLADIPGIGRRTAAMLADYNLKTAADVQKTDRQLLVATFGERFGQVLHEAAWGRGQTHLELEYEQKSISRDTSFEQDTTDMGYIRSMLYYLTERACRTLRQMGQAARTVSVKLRYNDFATVGKARTLGEPSNHDDVVYGAARELLEKLYTRAIAVRLVGVHLSGLVSDEQMQLRIWEQQIRRGRLYETSDRIRDRYGFCALMKGPAIELMGKMEQDSAGLKLRTACLTK